MSGSATRWYVVHTRPHQERRAEANLVRQGFRTWLPVMERSRRHARRIDTVCAAVVLRLAPGERVEVLLEVLGGRVPARLPRRAVVAAA